MSWLANRRRGVIAKKTNPYLMTAESNPEVFALCLAQGWCTADGMTYEDAAKVKSIGNVLRQAEIIHFDEFEFFTNVNNTFNFLSCTKLETIKLPPQITSIGAQVFRSCTKLEYIDIKSNVTSMGNYVFHTCSSLKNVYIHATTPPTAGTNIFINVPTGTLRYASCIKTMPT